MGQTRRERALARVDRAYGMLERAGCFLTLPASCAPGQRATTEEVRAVYARVLEAQRALARAMRDLAPDYRGSHVQRYGS